jgi:hypothetical protein
MFGGGQKGEACTVAFANQPLDLCLLEEGEEPRRIPQIFGDDVLECWGQGGGLGLVFALLLNTSLSVRGGVCGLEGCG